MISDVIDLFEKGVNFSEETDTHVSVSVHVNERAAEQFAKNYAPDVVILQPKRLRDKLRDDLKKRGKHMKIKKGIRDEESFFKVEILQIVAMSEDVVDG